MAKNLIWSQNNFRFEVNKKLHFSTNLIGIILSLLLFSFQVQQRRKFAKAFFKHKRPVKYFFDKYNVQVFKGSFENDKLCCKLYP